jgi:hypothetical protein
MKKPIRTTLVFGLLSSLIMLPVIWYEGMRWAWPSLFELAIWAMVAVYAVLLCRWGRVGFLNAIFPLLLLFGVAVWPTGHRAFLLIGLGVFSWIRSGICFRTAPLRALMAELVTVFGAACLIALWWPQSALAWALGVWFFFLVQTLYFFFVPVAAGSGTTTIHRDPFEQARVELERILEHN